MFFYTRIVRLRDELLDCEGKKVVVDEVEALILFPFKCTMGLEIELQVDILLPNDINQRILIKEREREKN